MKKYSKRPRIHKFGLGLALLIAVIGYTFYRLTGGGTPEPLMEIELTKNVTEPVLETSAKIGVIGPKDVIPELDPAEHIPIYLTGAVYMPGLYWVPVDSILYEIVDAAGGLKDDAADTDINLAMRVVAHQWFHIPTKEELEEDPAAASVVKAYPGTSSEPININTATQAELETLPGIGPATAGAIIRYREANGPFLQIEDLMNITGIKQSRFEAIETYITVK
jgi:competence protein ComEA